MSCWLICVLAVVATVVVASGGVTVFVVPSAVAGTAPAPRDTARADGSLGDAPVTPSVAGAVVSVTPARIADSRVNQQIPGAVPALDTVTVQVTGQGGVPASDVAAAVLNVTVVSPQNAGYLTVWPSGIDRTPNSNLNFQAGQNIPNTVIVPVGADGKIQLFNGSWGTVSHRNFGRCRLYQCFYCMETPRERTDGPLITKTQTKAEICPTRLE